MTRTLRNLFDFLLAREDLNFLVTNRIPRGLATRFMGWFSRIEQQWVADLSIRAWRALSDLDLDDAKHDRFRSLHDCFIRELREGARPVDGDPAAVVSPCDAVVGACGDVDGTRVWQAKGFPYALRDLLGADGHAETFRDGSYVTLRITATMYHRFHAPHDCRVEGVTYFSGDTWNVNPIALQRVERLFCRNERAAIRIRLAGSGHPVTLVAVAAILVAGIRVHALGTRLHPGYRGPHEFRCDTVCRKGDEMGWFEHGSTILVFAPAGFTLHEQLREGKRVRAGEPLLRLP